MVEPALDSGKESTPVILNVDKLMIGSGLKVFNPLPVARLSLQIVLRDAKWRLGVVEPIHIELKDCRFLTRKPTNHRRVLIIQSFVLGG